MSYAEGVVETHEGEVFHHQVPFPPLHEAEQEDARRKEKKKGIGKLWKSVKRAVSDVTPKQTKQSKQSSLTKSRGRSGVMTMQQMLERDAELRAEHHMALESGMDVSPDFGVWLAKKQGRPPPGTPHTTFLLEELGTPRSIPTPRANATPRQQAGAYYPHHLQFAPTAAALPRGTPPDRYLTATPPEVDTGSAQYSTTPPTHLSASSQPNSRTPQYTHQYDGHHDKMNYMHPVIDDSHNFAPSHLQFQPHHSDDPTQHDLDYTDEDETLSL